MWGRAILAQGSLKRYQMICRNTCTALPSSSPGGVLCGWAQLAQGSLKRYQMICITPCTAVPSSSPLWCFVRVASPRPWVSKEIPDDLQNSLRRRPILIPMWCLVRVGSPRPGVSKEIPDYHNGGNACGQIRKPLGAMHQSESLVHRTMQQ